MYFQGERERKRGKKKEKDERFDGHCIKDEVGGLIGTACEFWRTVTHRWA